MHVVIWEYQVRADHVAEFERVYASEGAWAELFRKSEGYLGTELLRDSNDPLRYVTIDRWTSSEAYDLFFATHKQDYDALDSYCQDLTERESFLGTFVPF